MRSVRTYRKMHFNSRPHEEVDMRPPTRGRRLIGISTHDLTKRSTPRVDIAISNALFQLTTSRRGRRQLLLHIWRKRYFNSRPHEEVDALERLPVPFPITFQLTTSRRGRPHRFIICNNLIVISTHDLTKRSTFS